jgi:predicted nucleotidyltransferase component of viral defense system
MFEQEERLLAQILDIFAQKFDKKAVLRGGMVLRILGSPRFTNDLDYVFVPYSSKKEIVEEILTCLSKIENAEITHSLNSKCLRVAIATPEATVQVEAKVAMEVKIATSSTRLFSPLHQLPPRLIPVMDYELALAHKMAAWNERRLTRDIYDIWFYLQMGIRPDEETLAERLKKPLYSKLVKKKAHFKGKAPTPFYDFIRDHVSTLTDEIIANELADYLPPDQLPGLAMQFRAAFTKL